jgi:hypothetical protein
LDHGLARLGFIRLPFALFGKAKSSAKTSVWSSCGLSPNLRDAEVGGANFVDEGGGRPVKALFGHFTVLGGCMRALHCLTGGSATELSATDA